LEIKEPDVKTLLKEKQDEIDRLKAQAAILDGINVSRQAQIALTTVVASSTSGAEPLITSGSAAIRGLTTMLIQELKEHAAATKDWTQMANAAWGSRMSEHCGNLGLEMERRSMQFFGTCKTVLDAVAAAVSTAMEAVPTAISEQVGEIKATVSAVVPAVVDAVVPAVVQGLINSQEFKTGLQAAVQTVVHSDPLMEKMKEAAQAVVHSDPFMEKMKEAAQAAVQSPQFQEKVQAAVRTVVLSTEFLDALAARVTLAQQPTMQQLLQQTSPTSHPPYPPFSSPPPPGAAHWQQGRGGSW
jgi:uncharacterized membrane protein